VTQFFTLFDVSIDGVNSTLFYLLGKIQGSILGPNLYVIFAAPMFDFEYLEVFAADNFIPRIEVNLTKLVCDIEKSLESNTKWLRLSAIRLLGWFFKTGEILQLLTSNLFSILYCTSGVWHLTGLYIMF
jgi:hypothetical protein